MEYRDEERDDMEYYEHEAHMAEKELEFNRLVNNNKYSDAYKLVVAFPDIVDYFGLVRLADVYAGFENNLGKHKADDFKNILLEKVFCLEKLAGVNLIDEGIEDSVRYFRSRLSPESWDFLKSEGIEKEYVPDSD